MYAIMIQGIPAGQEDGISNASIPRVRNLIHLVWMKGFKIFSAIRDFQNQ